jgi:hypothetical protein
MQAAGGGKGGGVLMKPAVNPPPPPPHTHTHPSPHPARPVCACASEAHARCVLPVESAALHARTGAFAVGAAIHFVEVHLPRVDVPAMGAGLRAFAIAVTIHLRHAGTRAARQRCRGGCLDELAVEGVWPGVPQLVLLRSDSTPPPPAFTELCRGRNAPNAWRRSPLPRCPPVTPSCSPRAMRHPTGGDGLPLPHSPPRLHCPGTVSCTHVPAQGSTRTPHSQLPCRDACQQATSR